MSKTIYENAKGLIATAFVGRSGNASVQLTIMNPKDYVELSSEEVLDLVITLLKRINRVEGYRATD